MSIFKFLNRNQKEAIGLLQMGTFLEYFDLMLYVHMAVLLNDLFFPKSDPHTAALITAFAFCSTYLLRPFGALLFGYIGDHIGRKTTVIITTIMMAISCTIMASLPTYAQIGIAATWVVTACRIVQGLSSMGEVIGAEVYVSELVKAPAQYTAVGLIGAASQLGAVVALGIGSLVTHFGFNWRIAFWVGAGIAVIGSVARTNLRETPEFLEKIQQIRNRLKSEDVQNGNAFSRAIREQRLINNSKMNRKTYWAYTVASFGWPLIFYITYMFLATPLKNICGYSSEDVIFHNFLVSVYSLTLVTILSFVSFKIHPLKILKVRGITNIFVMILLPFAIINSTSHVHVFLIQILLTTTAITIHPAYPVFLKHIPTLKRLTTASFIYALSRAVVYIITSFSLVFLTESFGYYGLWIVTVPISVGFLWAVNHLEKLEAVSAVIRSDVGLAA